MRDPRHIAHRALVKIRKTALALQSSGDLSRSRNVHIIPEHLASSAYAYFTAPADSRPPLAEGPVDKPAEMACIEFPGRTDLASFHRTVLNVPAGLDSLSLLMKRKKKKHVPLDMHGNLTPSLFKALNRLERRP